MKALAKVLKILAYAWGIVVVITVIIGLYGIFREKGFSEVLKTMSPFNLWNTFLIILLLLPAWGLYALADYILKRKG